MRIDERSRVLGYRMTSQCASGSGQFLENVARYLGIACEDVGPLSCEATQSASGQQHLRGAGGNRRDQHGQPRHLHTRHPERNSSLDGGPLSETTAAIDAHGTWPSPAACRPTPGLAQALQEKARSRQTGCRNPYPSRRHYAGALGAALWGAYRHRMLTRHAEVMA